MADPFRDSDVTLSDVEDDGDIKAGLLPNARVKVPRQRQSLRQRASTLLKPRCPSFATVCVGLLLVVTNAITWKIAKRAETTSTQRACPGNVGEPPRVAKVLRELDVTQTHPVSYDSTFHNYGSPYRGRPGPETDAVWENEAGAAFGFILIPEDEAEEAGISSDHLHFDGKGDQDGLEGYPVHIEVFHQIHCLNLLRMSTWYNADYYRSRGQLAFSHPEHQQIEHVDHCIDNIRQRLMCTVDVGLIPFYWVNETTTGSHHAHGSSGGSRIGTDPDFRQPHTCRDFSRLHTWMKKHMLDMPANRTLMPRPGDFTKGGFT